jgi:hypothetical protein
MNEIVTDPLNSAQAALGGRASGLAPLSTPSDLGLAELAADNIDLARRLKQSLDRSLRQGGESLEEWGQQLPIVDRVMQLGRTAAVLWQLECRRREQ